jgi:MFS transporter, DHA1 family, tetracycline resistance protein
MKRSPLIILFFTVFLDLVGFGIVLPLLPNYARELGASPLQIGIIAGAYSLMQFFFSPIWGGISDRTGRRPIILISVMTSVVSYFIFSQAQTLVLLFISRLLAGIGSANVSVTQAYITDISTRENRAKSLGILGAAFGLGFVLGPPIGGFLKTNFGIEYVGYIASALTLLDFALAFFLLPESLTQKKDHAEFKFFSPQSFIKAFRRPELVRVMLINFCFTFAFVNMQISVPLLWKEHYGQTDENIGYLFAFVGVMSVIVQGVFIGKITRAIGERQTLFYGTAIMTFGIGLIPFVPTGFFLSIGLTALALLALGNGLSTPTNSALVTLYTPPEEQGEMLGIAQSIGSLARIFGPLSGSLLYAAEYHAPYLIGAAFLIVGSVLSVTLFRYQLAARVTT